MSYPETSPAAPQPDDERDPSQPGLAPQPDEGDPSVAPEPAFPAQEVEED